MSPISKKSSRAKQNGCSPQEKKNLSSVEILFFEEKKNVYFDHRCEGSLRNQREVLSSGPLQPTLFYEHMIHFII